MAHKHHHDHHSHHDHHGHHHANPESYNRAFAIATFVNFGFVIAEVIYAILASSMSLLADAGHNLGDVLGLALSWGANWLMTKPANQRYSYGFKKTSILAAFINAVLLIVTTALIARESIEKLLFPSSVNETIVIVVALVGIVINGGTALLFLRGQHGDLNIRGAFLHLASDALLSLGVALGGALMIYTGWTRIDPILGLLIVATILYTSWELFRNSILMVLDAVPHSIDQEAVKSYLLSLPGIQQIHDLHIWSLSTRETALTAHLVTQGPGITDEQLHEIHEALLEKFNIHHATLQIEDANSPKSCGRLETC